MLLTHALTVNEVHSTTEGEFLSKNSQEISPFVFGVDIGAVVQEILNHSHAIVAGGKVERSGVTTLQVSTVHILRGAKLLCKTKPNNIKPNA